MADANGARNSAFATGEITKSINDPASFKRMRPDSRMLRITASAIPLSVAVQMTTAAAAYGFDQQASREPPQKAQAAKGTRQGTSRERGARHRMRR